MREIEIGKRTDRVIQKELSWMYVLEVEIDGEKEDESEREVRKCLRKNKSKGERERLKGQ